MSISASSVVAARVADVYAWRERPGALTRHTPPRQPIRMKREASNLCIGRAERQHTRPPGEFRKTQGVIDGTAGLPG
jgi:hypothetical protein